jgi:hypothetical protein
MFSKPIVLPETSFQAANLVLIEAIGVSDWAFSSLSILRRLRLSTMVTSWPASDRWSDVGQPQKPSPPKISNLMVVLLDCYYSTTDHLKFHCILEHVTFSSRSIVYWVSQMRPPVKGPARQARTAAERLVPPVASHTGRRLCQVPTSSCHWLAAE